MSLSNTAAPKYYSSFRDDVINGKIPVCREITLQMNLIDELIKNPNFYYDPEPVEQYIRFCENELTLTNGDDLHLLDSFKLWAEDIFGWYYFVPRSVYEPSSDNHGGRFVNRIVKRRLRKKQFLIVGRGASKSLYGGSIQGHVLVCKRKTTQGLVTAPTKDLTEGIMSPLKTAMVRSRGPLFKFMTFGSINNTTGPKTMRPKLTTTKKGIENFINNSSILVRPMSIDKLQGYHPDVATVDEWLSGDIKEDVIGALEQGGGKNPDFLIVAMSSEGTVRNGAGDTIKMELMSILKGEYYNPHVSIWWYKLDDVKEVGDPNMWLKANPNLGKTVQYEDYKLDVERAEQSPSARNDILAKRFGIPMEGFTYFFKYEDTLPHKKRNYWKMSCALGADLSRGDDFCAFVFLFPLSDGSFGIKCRAYVTSRNVIKLPTALRLKYNDFMEEGTLCVFDSTVLDMDEVYEDLDKFIETYQYCVCAFGYDPYNAKNFVSRWELEHGSYFVERVPQGPKTESVPLGELKTLAEDRMLLFDEQIMTFAMGNAITLEDTNGNRKLWKRRHEQKIDPVAAMMDAYIAYKAFGNNF